MTEFYNKISPLNFVIYIYGKRKCDVNSWTVGFQLTVEQKKNVLSLFLFYFYPPQKVNHTVYKSGKKKQGFLKNTI